MLAPPSQAIGRAYHGLVSGNEQPLAGKEQYLHGHHPSVLRIHEARTVDNSASYLAPYLKPGMTLLDVGAGPGTITIDFARRLDPGHVIGIDPSQEVVDRAVARAVTEGVTNVSFTTGNVYELEYEDDSFDIVHAHQVLQYMADPVKALQEMRRVVKPGGIIAARDVDYGGVRWYPWVPGIEVWRDLYQKVSRLYGGEPDAGPQLKDWALRAGFETVRCTASIWCFSDREDREWWGGAWSERALASTFATQALESGLATQEELEEISAAWLEWVDAENGVFDMPHNEILAWK